MSEVPEIGAFVNAHSGVPTGACPPVAPRVRSRSRLLDPICSKTSYIPTTRCLWRNTMLGSPPWAKAMC